jgi:hypothetical protein
MTTGPDDDVDDAGPGDLDDLDDLGDGDDEDDEEYVPPTKAEFEKMRAKIKRQEDRITRLTGKTPRGKSIDQQLQDQMRGKGRKPAGRDDDDEDDGAAGQRALEEANERTKRSAGVAALMGAGLSRDQAKRAVRLIDMRSVDLDDDGDVDIEDEIEDLREQFPEMFSKSVAYRRRPGARTAPEPERRQVKTATQKTDEALMKQAGFDVTGRNRPSSVRDESQTERELRRAGYR